MAGLSTLAAVAIAFVTPATDPRVLDAFYRRVEPDGFWGATAARAGLDPAGPVRRLALALRVTAVTATSLFCLLVGVGQLLIGSPERTLWPVGLVVVGLALTPSGPAPSDPKTSPIRDRLACPCPAFPRRRAQGARPAHPPGNTVHGPRQTDMDRVSTPRSR
jgi:hypothetical protein